MSASIPLCVDLDGTLLQTDTLLESLMVAVKRNPLAVLAIPFWLSRGRAHLKCQLSRRAQLAAASLPVNSDLLEFLKSERESGRRLILVTGADYEIGRAVAEHLGIFEEVCASDGKQNLSGTQKARVLVERFGKGGFDYAGNEGADFPVWREARRAIVVHGSEQFAGKVASLCEVERVFKSPAAGLKVWFRSFRVHQWAKNLLLFVPLVGAHQWRNLPKLAAVVLAFLAFSICASSVYMLNDLFDLEADRSHRTKRLRPFASGRLSLRRGIIGAPLLLLVSALLASRLAPAFGVAFAGYYVLTFAYSLRLKQIEILDVLALAGLYGVRVVAGGYAAQVAISDWLLVFSLFIFLSLAFAKRFTELKSVRATTGDHLKGRGYRVSDLELVSNMGLTSGYVAVLVFALYVTNPVVTALYERPAALWAACPVLLYWISRVWLLAHRGLLHDDPIIFALKDKQSWLVCLVLVLIGAVALPK